MTVSKFVAFLAWSSFFVGLWFGWSADAITAFQWFVIVASFVLGLVAGAWQMERK